MSTSVHADATPGPSSGAPPEPTTASDRSSRRSRLEEALLPPLVALLLGALAVVAHEVARARQEPASS